MRELRRAIGNERVLAAVAAMPRDAFVPDDQRGQAYDNVALSIGEGQTISQPLVVARMLELLDPRPAERVLDVGTGSGYHAALLAGLSGHVWTIERHGALSAQAGDTLAGLGIANVTLIIGDGGGGLAAQAPFDCINVAAACPRLPEALARQLAPGGRLVVPVGDRRQFLVRVTRTPEGLVVERHDPVRFVPLVRAPGS